MSTTRAQGARTSFDLLHERPPLALTLAAALAIGCSCGDEDTNRTTPGGDAGVDARQDAARLDATGDGETDARADAGADTGPVGPTRGTCGETAWTLRFGGSPAERALGDERGTDVAVAPNGDVVATGWYEGSVDFGGGPRAVGGDNNAMFVARFGSDGTHQFSRGFGDPNPGLLTAPQARGRAIALDADEGVLVAGQFAGTVDFGRGPISSREIPVGADAGTDAGLPICISCVPDAVVLKLDRTGSTQWVKHFGDDGSDTARAVADSSGTTIVAGTVAGNVDFGDGITVSSGAGDAFVLALDGSGAYAFATRLAGTGEDDAYGVAVDSNGNIFVVGSFSESMMIGTTTLSSSADADAFIVKLDSGGRPLWAKQLGATQLALALGVAVDSQGAVVVIGGYRGNIDAGGGTLTSAFNDAFVVKLDAGGNHVFSRSFGGVQNDEADAVAVDGRGRVIVTGSIGSDSVDFGGGPISGGRSDDLFVVVLEPDAKHVCSRRYGSASGSSGGLGLAVDSNGNAIVAGALSGTVDFGAGPVASTGGLDLLIAKFLD